ncbi:unnamed protein product [Durusdinium trenchii]|uniref:Rhodanese domain-containing protein n=1 Tax=Durusdinium trenchii TaxID=1381693 RepID=A0ABP0K953_9DINO
MGRSPLFAFLMGFKPPEQLILDVRPEEDFLRGHLRGAYNVPWADMASRGFELPTRSTPFTVCCAEEDLDEIQEWFDSRTKPWMATVQPVPEELPEEGPSAVGHFLFSVSPLLEDSEYLLEELRMRHLPEVPKALDVGCGSGREAILLATRGWKVTALDRDQRALDRLGTLAERQGCNEICGSVCCTLADSGDLLAAVEELGHFQLVMVNRHLHRPTLLEIVDLLAPGGLLLFHTFMEGCSHPKDPEHLLRPGELSRTFGNALELLRDEELPGEDGRVMSFFVARKRS